MKEGWEIKRLGDACELITQGPNPKYDKGEHDDFRVLKTKDLYDEVIHYESADRISKDVFSLHLRAELKSGDVLLAIVGQGSINKCNVFENKPGKHFIFTRALGLLRPRRGLLDSYFLKHFLHSSAGKEMVDSGIAGTSGQQIVTTTHLKNLKIFLPPLAEQQRIVGVLDEAFAGLVVAQANAAKNLQNARALFESHLQAVFSQRGEGWVEKTLEEISSTFGRGKSRHRPRNAPHLYGGKYPFVQTGDIRNAEHIVTEYSQTYSDAGLAQSKLWPKGTICITIAANIAETAILGFDACFPDSVIGIVANPKEAEVGFIEYVLQSFKASIQAMGKGSAQANINMGTFENERFPFPSVGEQKRIVTQLDALSTETQCLTRIYEQKQSLLAALKKSLLHQAFTGQL